MKANWDDMLPWHQAQALAYDQIRSIEDAQLAMAGKGLF